QMAAVFDVEAAGVYRWEEERGVLVAVRSTHPSTDALAPIAPGEGAAGRAFRAGAPVILNDYQLSGATLAPWQQSGVRAALGAPLLYEGRRLGAISIGSVDAERRFGPDEA